MNNINLDLPSLGILLGAAHAFFLAIYLLSLKSDFSLSFRILAVLLLSMSIGMFGNVLHQQEFFLLDPYLGLLFPANEFLYGPLFFLFVVSMLNREFVWKRSFYLHFTPAFFFIISWFMQGLFLKRLAWEMDGQLLKLLISIQFLIYLIFSFNAWYQHSLEIRNFYASLEKIRMNWLRNILGGMCLIYLISLSSFVFTGAEMLKLAPLVGAILIYVTAYLGMKHARLFAIQDMGESKSISDSAKNEKYRNSALSTERKQAIRSKMETAMEQDKLFADNQLTLPKLAAHIEVSTHHLSQVLNEDLRKTFFDFVNEYRVNEVKKLMVDPAFVHYNLLGLALEAGFNSKSTFNSVFKNFTGNTPLQYRKWMLENQKMKSVPIGKGVSN